MNETTDEELYALYKEAMKRFGYYHRQTDTQYLMSFARGALLTADQDDETVVRATGGKGALTEYLIEVWQRPSVLAEDKGLRKAFEVICREVAGQ